MDKTLSRNQIIENIVSWTVLFVILIYTYGILIAAPYSGFYFNSTTGQIEKVYIQMGNAPLQAGDIITRLENMDWQQIKNDRRLVLFKDHQKGDPLKLRVDRNGQFIEIDWSFPGFNRKEFFDRAFNSWVVGYAFWLAGFVAQLSIRPRDARRRLFIAANYLIAIFLVSGSLSSRHLWESSTLLHTSAWLMTPVFLQLHWEFPQPFGKTSKPFWSFFYTIAFVFAFAEAFHTLWRNLYAFGFLTAMVGSIFLLVAHLIVHKDERREVSLLLLSIFIAFSFSLAAAVAVAFGTVINIGWFAVFSMPFMPLAYFYLIYRRQLGGMETKVNRLITIYAFLILIGLIFFAAVIIAIRMEPSQEGWIIISAALTFITVVSSAIFLPSFQKFIDQRVFGIKLPYQNLTETYSSRIAASDDLPSLLALLENEVFPSLLIRQYAFLQVQGKALKTLLAKNIPNDPFNVDSLTQNVGRNIPKLTQNDGWARFILPLKVGDKTLGFWLLGKRDPDDLYPQAEVPILKSLADQTAIALSNIVQSNLLRDFYQTDIQSVENERRRISRGLHDDVLNELAAMRNSLGHSALSPAFIETYEKIKLHVRDVINDLRPSALDQGLAHALQEYLEDIQEKNLPIKIHTNIQSTEERISETKEEHLYNIVREACANALHHAHAHTLTVSGIISPERVELSIQDDGEGFDSHSDLNTLLANGHYGLAHMKERAQIIGAEMEIISSPNFGTTILLTWK